MSQDKEIKKRIIIIVATHKPYMMPDNPMYLPLHVGAEGKIDEKGNPLDFGFAKDNTGDNISNLNSSFCELTGLYWAWKNIDSDFIGLVHYRRYFGRKKRKDPFKGIITYRDIEPYLCLSQVFVPKKRRYYIETLYSHYKHTLHVEPLDMARQIISEKYPDYLLSFDKVVKQRSGHMFNMMIMRRDRINEYCSWLFDILFSVKDRIDTSDYSPFQSRIYGFLSEILFNVWLDHSLYNGNFTKDDVEKLPVVHIEKINWIKKGNAFLKAKLLNKKYDSSF